MNTVEISSLFYELRATRGSNDKMSFIFKNRDNKDFLEVLKFLFDPRVTTGLAKKKMQKEVGATPYFNERNDLRMMLGYIKEHNTGTDEVVKSVQSWILGQPEETHEFLTGLFIKDFPCGVSSKSINEALGYELIFRHEVMLGNKYSEKMDTVKGNFYLTLKMDDNRATYIPSSTHEEPSIFISRQGQVFEGLSELHEVMSDLPLDYVYDGGLISANESLHSKDRYRETGSILRKKGEKTGLQFIIYDIIPMDEWKGKVKPKMTYSERRVLLTSILSAREDMLTVVSPDSGILKLVKPVKHFYFGDDKEMIFPLLQQVIADGEEGLMLNTANGVYEKKRSNSLLKVKEFYTADLRVIGYKEHKHGNKLGAFIVDYKGNPTNVGFGFSDAQREEYWKDRDELVGKIIEVKYFQESKNKDGKLSIRHGGFERLRLDKDDVSYN